MSTSFWPLFGVAIGSVIVAVALGLFGRELFYELRGWWRRRGR
jgi:hypothetical protein